MPGPNYLQNRARRLDRFTNLGWLYLFHACSEARLAHLYQACEFKRGNCTFADHHAGITEGLRCLEVRRHHFPGIAHCASSAEETITVSYRACARRARGVRSGNSDHVPSQVGRRVSGLPQQIANAAALRPLFFLPRVPPHTQCLHRSGIPSHARHRPCPASLQSFPVAVSQDCARAEPGTAGAGTQGRRGAS